MSHSHQGRRPEFPELSIPHIEQSYRRSPLRVIEPYVEFAADIEANVAKIEIGSADRIRTANAKKSRSSGGATGTATGGGAGRMTPTQQGRGGATSGSGNNSGSPSKPQLLKSSTPGPQTKSNRAGPESSRTPSSSARSPRCIKTAPEAASRQNKGQYQQQQGQGQGQSMHSNSNFSDEGSDVRESLLHLKKNTVSDYLSEPVSVYISSGIR
jgi:hypothetical protein